MAFLDQIRSAVWAGRNTVSSPRSISWEQTRERNEQSHPQVGYNWGVSSFFFRFSLLLVACCLLPVVCCYLLPVACCMLHVACCLLPVACCLLHVACCLLPVAYWLVQMDGTSGEQPRGMLIEANICHELGHFEKQVSCAHRLRLTVGSEQ